MIEWLGKDQDIISADAGQHGADCGFEGICNPKITFFRNGYNIVMYPWETVYQGNDYEGQSPGLCQGGVLNQFHAGGDIAGYT